MYIVRCKYEFDDGYGWHKGYAFISKTPNMASVENVISITNDDGNSNYPAHSNELRICNFLPEEFCIKLI